MTKVTHIPFFKTGYFSKTMIDYINQEKSIEPFYHNFPSFDGFQKQMVERSGFPVETRKVLMEVLKEQYIKFETSESTFEHIELLSKSNTFTVTTGHQLNLFTGPLYFLYKIISTINLCEDLSEKFPDKNFVPVYWMATEDHDFDEINYFNFKGTKVVWNREDGGAVGRFSTAGLKEVFDQFSKHLGPSRNATYVKNLFEKAYLEHTNLSEATRYIANELFGPYGLVVIDADDHRLKQLFVPYMKQELQRNTSYKKVTQSASLLGKNYKVQVNPREINLFYLGEDSRERIIKEDDSYSVNGTNISWTEAQLLDHLEEAPDRFSPNVILRPLYQEVILPNLCYIGGGGELAYWLELKSFFDSVDVPFPILLLRNSVLLVSEKQAKKLDNLSISLEEIFQKQNDLLANKVRENSEIQFNFGDASELLNQQFLALRRVAEKTDASFIGAVDAQFKKQTNGLKNLEKRLLRAEKRKQVDLVERITDLQNALFPNQSLEERQRNFSEFYLEYGPQLISALKESLKPLQLEFTVLTM